MDLDEGLDSFLCQRRESLDICCHGGWWHLVGREVFLENMLVVGCIVLHNCLDLGRVLGSESHLDDGVLHCPCRYGRTERSCDACGPSVREDASIKGWSV
jgi:hypothetical protein